MPPPISTPSTAPHPTGGLRSSPPQQAGGCCPCPPGLLAGSEVPQPGSNQVGSRRHHRRHRLPRDDMPRSSLIPRLGARGGASGRPARGWRRRSRWTPRAAALPAVGTSYGELHCCGGVDFPKQGAVRQGHVATCKKPASASQMLARAWARWSTGATRAPRRRAIPPRVSCAILRDGKAEHRLPDSDKR